MAGGSTVTFSGRMKQPREHLQRRPQVEYRPGGLLPPKDLEPGNVMAGRMRESESALEESFESVGSRPVEREKTFSASARGATVSGYTYIPEREVAQVTPANVRTRAEEIGHPRRANKNDQGIPGQYFDSHAEKKQIVANPNRPVGVNREMCADCVRFFSREAQAQRTAQVVSDPVATRVFHPDGAITVYARDGSVLRINPDGTVSTLPSSMRRAVTP
jgi:hypothetical protein